MRNQDERDSAKIIAVVNQKGGVAKTTTVVSLASALTKLGRKVLTVDCDPQSSLTMSMGYELADHNATLVDLIVSQIRDGGLATQDAIVHTSDADLIPTTLQMSGIESEMYGAMRREYLIAEILEPVKDDYDYILLDCPPTLGMLTINALTAANGALIPVVPDFLSLMGLQDLLTVTIPQIKRRLNRQLRIAGILPTKVRRERVDTDMLADIRATYGEMIHLFEPIPYRASVKQASAQRISCMAYEDSDAARAYRSLAEDIDGKEGACGQAYRHREGTGGGSFDGDRRVAGELAGVS